MKKFFKKAFVVLGIAGMGLTTTSCDEVLNLDWGSLLSDIMNNVFTSSKTHAYQGSYTLQHLTSDGKGYYKAQSEVLTFSGATIEASKTGDYSISLVLPGTDGIGDATMSNITISGLEFVKDEENGQVTTKIDLGENSYIDGTLTIDGKTIEASNLFIDATITADKLVIGQASIYFGENAEEAINVTFNGNVVAEEQ